ncbi:MAG: hypothetical protein GFH25_541210n130 [Chloroflexi bacterium AL-N10]|nr:hypothetical protein [Chloroflexi bacterium AL-N10]
METKTIAICGAPQVGKPTLFTSLARLTHAPRIGTNYVPGQNVTRLEVVQAAATFQCPTLSGVCVPDKTDLPRCMHQGVAMVL